MSQQNVEVVRRCFDLFGRGDMEALLRYVDPAIEASEPAEIPGAASYLGHAGLARAYERWASQWNDFRVELEELIEAEDEVVGVTGHHGTGPTSGAPVERRVVYVLPLHDSKLVRMRTFSTRAQALDAVGLQG